jgi:hypothetical protein
METVNEVLTLLSKTRIRAKKRSQSKRPKLRTPEVAMDNVVEVVALLRQQAALDLMNTAGPAVAVDWALATTRRRLVAYPEALAAVVHTARALRRSPETLSVRDVTYFRGSN